MGEAYRGKGETDRKNRCRRLVAEAWRNGDLVAAFGAAAIEHRGTRLGLHAGQKAVNFATAAAVRLKGALGHGIRVILTRDVGWAGAICHKPAKTDAACEA